MLTVDEIIKITCDFYGARVEDVLSTTRKGTVIYVKHISMYLADKFLNVTLQGIASHFKSSGRQFTHATILHAIKSVKNQIETNASYRIKVNELERKIEELVNVDEEVFMENDFFN